MSLCRVKILEILRKMNARDCVTLLLLLLWKTPCINSIHLRELRVPPYAAVGGELQLICRFRLDGDLLYSVKWYKNGREFYRYVPKNQDRAISFTSPGVHVDMTRSASDVVTLTDVERSTEGMYRCEVSGERPLFATVADQAYVTVHVLPETGPRAKGLQTEYNYGDQVLANCTSAPSYPEAQLKWMINGKPAPNYYLKGPWHRVGEAPDTVETILQLKFIVKPLHFKEGVMKLKCQAIIPPQYKQETTHTISLPSEPEIEPDLEPPTVPEDINFIFPVVHSTTDGFIQPPPYESKAIQSMDDLLVVILTKILILIVWRIIL